MKTFSNPITEHSLILTATGNKVNSVKHLFCIDDYEKHVRTNFVVIFSHILLKWSFSICRLLTFKIRI
jgi:hypothetical protein